MRPLLSNRCDISERTINWPIVCRAFGEVRFTGWRTAEVNGGNRKRLADIIAICKALLCRRL
jgi:hypothetical protein